MDDKKIAAKRKAIETMKKVMGDISGKDFMDHLESGKMEAKVIAEDPEGLKKGLEKAEEVVEEIPEMDMESEEGPELDMMEDDEVEMDYENLSREELIELLKMKEG